MYLSRVQLEAILLHNGFNLSLIEKIYISCEYGASKRSGTLYKLILEETGIEPNQLLHVGDHEISDISVAKHLGIQTDYYNTISIANEKHPFLYLEQLRDDNNATEIFALRNYVGSLYKNENQNDMFWHQMGAMIFGPLFTYGMEWVLDIAEKEGIKKILPLMREGKLLGNLLRNAAHERSSDVEIVELYISRNSVYFPSLEKIDDNNIKYVLSTMNITVKDVFRILNIEDYGEKFEQFYDYEISKGRDILYAGTNLYDYLCNELQTDNMKTLINERAVHAKKIILEYFKQMGMEKRYITVDVGWRGSIQGSINRIQNKTENIHLLLMGLTSSLANVLDNCDLRGYVGSFGKNNEIIRDVFIRIFEMISTCDEGTTVGYEVSGGSVVPIKKIINYDNAEQLSNIKKCQEGIMDFQREYFKLRKRKSSINDLKYRPEELVKIIGRLTSSPLYTEAKILGDLYYDQNFGANKQWKIIDQVTINKIKESGMYRFLAQENSRQIEWYAALNVLNDPFYYFTSYYIRNGWNQKIKRLAFAQFIHKNTTGKLVIVGAGAAGRDIYKYLRLAGSEELVECFVDNDISKQDTYIYGKKVCSIDERFEADTYVVGSFAYITEIVDRIRTAKGHEVKIMTYRGELCERM